MTATMSDATQQLSTRIGRAGIGIATIVLSAGALAGAADPRIALLAGAVVLGWTRLVGL